MKSLKKLLKNPLAISIAVALVFLALRLPGLGQPYYQDEWKNVSASATVAGAGTFFAHPPLMQITFVADHAIFGEDYFRVLPLLFSLASLILLFLVVRRRFGQTVAIWSAVLYSVCFYNVLAALQQDVDGAILPFLFLLAVYAYDKCVYDKRWRSLLILALLAGLLIKLSFVLVIGAIILDYLWDNRQNGLIKKTAISAGVLALFGAAYVALLFLFQDLYPAFSISFMLGHANQFAGAGGRNWTQIAVQAIKAVFYLSPLLIAPLVWLSRETIKRTRVFWLYLALGFVFYFVLFDFSQGALDKYLMFAIVPLAIMAGAIFSEAAPERVPPVKSLRIGNFFATLSGWRRKAVLSLAGLIFAAALLVLNWLPQTVAALYPKSEWFGRVLHGHWNVLTPITGGSGPMGFYISFLFIAASFLVTIAIAAMVRVLPAEKRKAWLVPATLVIVLVGLSYNLVFAEEYLFGGLYGSSPQILSQAISFIAKDPKITQVISYNDIGNRELSALGKYAGRFYAAPQFEAGHEVKFANFAGYYMIVDIPHIYDNGFYGKFFASCKPVWSASSGRIDGKVYDCSH